MKAHIRQPKHTAPENQLLQLRHETKIPYLNSYGHETNETKISCRKNDSSYEHAHTSASKSSRIARNRPQKPLFQLRHETKNPYLNSYGYETNETKISYGKSISSYGSGLIPICEWPHIRLGTDFRQLRRETGNPYLNSYSHETSKTGQPLGSPQLLVSWTRRWTERTFAGKRTVRSAAEVCAIPSEAQGVWLETSLARSCHIGLWYIGRAKAGHRLGRACVFIPTLQVW